MTNENYKVHSLEWAIRQLPNNAIETQLAVARQYYNFIINETKIPFTPSVGPVIIDQDEPKSEMKYA